jgi:hypothetical protein
LKIQFTKGTEFNELAMKWRSLPAGETLELEFPLL